MAFLTKRTLKTFELTRKFLVVLGVDKSRLSQNHPFNLLNIRIMNTFIFSCISTILYLNYSHDTIPIQEYMISLYTAFTTAINGVLYAILIWKSRKVFVLIEGIESIIQESKYKKVISYSEINWNKKIKSSFLGLKYPESRKMYVEVNELIEKWCNIIYTIIIKFFVPILLLPKFVVSFFFYFYSGMDNDALELPFPT